MREISDRVQSGNLLARKVGSGEVGILRAEGKKIVASFYWNNITDAISDLLDIITYFESQEDE